METLGPSLGDVRCASFDGTGIARRAGIVQRASQGHARRVQPRGEFAPALQALPRRTAGHGDEAGPHPRDPVVDIGERGMGNLRAHRCGTGDAVFDAAQPDETRTAGDSAGHGANPSSSAARAASKATLSVAGWRT